MSDEQTQTRPTLREFLASCEGAVATLETSIGRTYTGKAINGLPVIGVVPRATVAGWLCNVDRAYCGARRWSRPEPEDSTR